MKYVEININASLMSDIDDDENSILGPELAKSLEAKSKKTASKSKPADKQKHKTSVKITEIAVRNKKKGNKRSAEANLDNYSSDGVDDDSSSSIGSSRASRLRAVRAISGYGDDDDESSSSSSSSVAEPPANGEGTCRAVTASVPSDRLQYRFSLRS
jgi:hypothetical protein